MSKQTRMDIYSDAASALEAVGLRFQRDVPAVDTTGHQPGGGRVSSAG